jgi:DNA repair protein RecN (Recombination protein N)
LTAFKKLEKHVLVSLQIRDLALVEKVDWTPREGFNTVTGETGAGKSVLIGAINLALGARADKTLIRQSAETASVEAVFKLKNQRLKNEIFKILDQAGIQSEEDEGEIIIKRTITNTSAGRQWINGSACTLNTLRTIGEMLVDFHGPHDHQSLLSASTQTSLLDSYAQATSLRQEVAQAWKQWREAEEFCQSLKTELGGRSAAFELLKDQMQEIERAAIRQQEDEEISARLAILSQSARLAEICHTLTEEIEESQNSIQTRLLMVRKLVRELAHIDNGSAAQNMLTSVESLQLTLQDLLNGVCHYAETLDADPETLSRLTDRYNLIQLIKKKYGPTLQDVLDFYQRAQAQISRYENREFELEAAEKKLQAAQKSYQEASAKLGAARKKAAPQLEEAIIRELRDLNFNQAKFRVQITDSSPGIYGNQQVEFLFSPNPGEGLLPLKAIASSGEMARVMLAIKTCLAAQDETPLLIFDEVDANIGGQTAVQVGQKLRQLGRHHQVLCITHLPQVAAAAETHFVVEKNSDSIRTKTSLRQINDKERVDELVRMLGGSPNAQKLAKTMLFETST